MPHLAEGDTLNFVREVLRSRPPVGAYRRVAHKELDLGHHGVVPKGCPMAIFLSPTMRPELLKSLN